MAKVFWTPNPADEGSAPSDITYEDAWGITESVTVNEDPDNELALVVDHGPQTAARRAVRISEIAGLDVDEENDIELYVKYRIRGAGNDIYILTRILNDIADPTNEEHAVFFRKQRGSGGVRTLSYYNDSSATTLDSENDADTANIVRHAVLRVVGTSAQARSWKDGDPDPGSFQLSGSQSVVNSYGGIGFGRFTGSAFEESYIYAIGVATEGETAPQTETDVTAPSLTSASATATGATTATGSVNTNEANGVIDSILSTSATKPTGIQVQAGQDHTGSAAAAADLDNAVTATGAQSFAYSGLPPETTLYQHSVHEDASGNVSLVETSAGFTTGSVGVTPVSFTGDVDDYAFKQGVTITPIDIASLASGTETPLAYNIQSGALPAGFDLDEVTGEITGAATESGAFSIVVRVTDDAGNTDDTNEFGIFIGEVISGFERSSVNAALSTVGIDIDDLLLFTLSARLTDTGTGLDRWLEPVARIAGVDGQRPRIEIVPYETVGGGDGENHQTWFNSQRGHFSYDGETWQPFDGTGISGDRLTFLHDTAFTQDEVWIARSWPISVTQVGEWIESLATAYPTLVSPTASAAAFTPSATTSYPAQTYIAEEIPGGDDELGRTIPTTPFYAFEITDGAPPQTGQITAGIHAGEDVGEVVLREFVEWLLSSDAEAQAVRARFKIIVYPMMNPFGRWAGEWRGQPGSTTDTNRDIVASPEYDSSIAYKTISAADESQTPAWAFDFHASPSGESQQLGKRTQVPPSVDFYDYAVARYGAGDWGVYLNESADPPHADGSVNTYNRDRGVPFTMVVETCDRPGPVSPTNRAPYAAAMGGALYEMVQDGSFGARIDSAAQQIAVTAHPAEVLTGTALQAALAAIEHTPYPATVDLGTAIGANVTAISLTTHPADASLGETISAAVHSITVTTHPAQVSTGAGISAAVQQIVLAPNQATVAQGTSIEAALAQIAVTPHAATIQTGAGITAQAQQIALQAFQAGVELGITIEGSLHQISVAALAATVGLGDQVDAFAAAIELTPHGASITLSNDLQVDSAQIQLAAFRATVTAGVQPLTVPGLEFTLPISRLHFTFTDEDR